MSSHPKNIKSSSCKTCNGSDIINKRKWDGISEKRSNAGKGVINVSTPRN